MSKTKLLNLDMMSLQNIDEDGHFLDHHTHIVPWYSPPIQRQRWGEDSVLPHVNWGDLFFDLFYVAMVSCTF